MRSTLESSYLFSYADFYLGTLMIYLPILPSTLLPLILMTILTSYMKLGLLMYSLSSEMCLTRNSILDAF